MADRRRSNPVESLPNGVDTGGAKRRPGRPPIHDEEWTKVTVVLFDRQIVFLDGIVASIRSRNGASVSRAQLIRAFVDAIGQMGIDVTEATSEADVRALVATRFPKLTPRDGSAGQYERKRHDDDGNERQDRPD